MLRFHIPPNIKAAILRNAIPLRVEANLDVSPETAELPALALLQRWCSTPEPPKFIQIDRAQLRELVRAIDGQPLFFHQNQDVPWPWPDLLGEPSPTDASREDTPPAPTRHQPSPTLAERDLTPAVVDGSEHYLAISLPSREHPGYASLLALLKENGFNLEPSNRKWWLRDRHKVLNFLATHGDHLRHRLDAELTANFETRTRHIATAETRARIEERSDGFDLSLGLGAGDAPESAVRDALASGRNYVEHRGKIHLFDQAALEKLEEAQRVLANEPHATIAPRTHVRVSRDRVPEVQELLDGISPNFQPPETWNRGGQALRDTATLPPAPIPTAFHELLRPYQRLGTAWLWYLHQQKLGGILADEMGLGKTLQALALLACLPPDSSRLVVAPASLLENWRRETARFVPSFNVFLHHGTQRIANAADTHRHDLIITSYGTLTRDRNLFAAIPFTCIIADEAQHIKNRHSQNARALRDLRADTRFLLTGTPLENSLDDLRALFAFLLPGYLPHLPPGIRGEDRQWHDQRLQARTAPYILRRTKQSVAPELPKKIEQTLWCEPSPLQQRLYREIQQRSERETFDLAADGASESRIRLATLTQLLRLRQLCCDPRLLFPDTPAAASGKLGVLRELIEEAVDDSHRVLIFSQFTSLLSLIREELEREGVAHCYLDGSMTATQRQAEVDRFQGSPDIPLFLLSLKAGGTGLNLTAADTVVHLDPWWNPAVEAQATDRAHRIGQTRTVTSYKLICSGTVEEKVLALQEEKRALLAGVFEASDAVSARLSLEDLQSLLA